MTGPAKPKFNAHGASAGPLELALGAARRLGPVHQRGDKYIALCPVHESTPRADGKKHKPSLEIKAGEKGVVVTCRSKGCDFLEIAAAWGLQPRDLFYRDGCQPINGNGHAKQQAIKPKRPSYANPEDAIEAARRTIRDPGDWKLVKPWSYTGRDGSEVMRLARFELNGDKTYRPVHVDAAGWHIGDPPGKLPIYNQPNVLASTGTVYVHEGEKSADAANAIGLLSTTSAHGATSANKTDWSPLAGRDVVIVRDNNQVGLDYANDVAGILVALDPPTTARVLLLPDLPDGGDIVDFLDARDSIESETLKQQILALAESAPKGVQAPDAAEIYEWNGGGNSPPIAPIPAFVFHTADEFNALDLRRDYHIPGILAAGPVPTIIAGSFKTLKTSIAMDLLISLATGASFLNHFPVTRAIRAAIMSGESGGLALQNLLRRIAHNRGRTAASIGKNLRLCTSVMDLSLAAHVSHIERFIAENEIRLFALDPAYLAMKGLRSDDAGSLFAMGRLLEPLARIGERTGCTMTIIHHNSRGATRANPGEPAELADIAWSGFAEWAGQWLLLSRREKFDPDSEGEHRLWLTAGGRDGHSNLVGVDVTEGRHNDQGGRRWDVAVEQACSVRRDSITSEQERREEDRKARVAKQGKKDRETILEAMRNGNGETRTAIRDRSGLNSARFSPAFAHLLAEHMIEPAEIPKANGQTYNGYRVTRTHPDSPGTQSGLSG